MQCLKPLSLTVFFILSLITSNCWAWGHHHFGFYYGGPFYGGSFYGAYGFGYPYPYYPPAVVTVPVPVTPPTYIQQAAPSPSVQQNQTAYWYYCHEPEGYYPYVKQCSGEWKLVEPRPQN